MEYNFEQHIDTIGEIADKINLDNITILTGRNAGGKSLIRKILRNNVMTKTGKSKVFIPHASQELRTKSNPEMGALSGMGQDLEWLATSYNTISTIDQVIDRDADYIIIDEPEIGIGEELQLGLADYINDKLKDRKCGVLIITHSRSSVRNIKHDDFINLEGMSEDEWLNRTAEKISIEEFKEFSNNLFVAVRDRINTNKSKNK